MKIQIFPTNNWHPGLQSCITRRHDRLRLLFPPYLYLAIFRALNSFKK
uniref:Uncharacterized protein n=1 Tax=Arundo donax TaxID=35708 RepID=A0A0A8ZIJ5_ARUDO